MNYHRGLLFWGLALVTGGAVALAAQQGYLDQDLLAGTWRLWPLILVAIGFSILVSSTPFAIVGTVAAALVVGAAGGALIAVGPGVACGDSAPAKLSTERGTFGDAARVSLDFNCGSLDVSTTDAGEWSVASARLGGNPARVTSGSDHLNVESGQGSRWWGGGGRDRWIVDLPKEPSYQLEITPNAADSTIDLGGGHFTSVSLQPNAGSVRLILSDAQVDDLDLTLNAGSAVVLIGAGTSMDASMSVNAGSIDVCIADRVAVSVTVDPNITLSTNLDESGLTQVGDTWSMDGYADAADQVHIDLEGNAASFTLNPDGGCS